MGLVVNAGRHYCGYVEETVNENLEETLELMPSRQYGVILLCGVCD